MEYVVFFIGAIVLRALVYWTVRDAIHDYFEVNKKKKGAV
jgi:hypothetical protein